MTRKSRTGSVRGKGWDGISNPVPGDVLACLEELGIEFRVNGNEALAKCPMHYARTGKQDGHPSWSVRVEDDDDSILPGTHNCFSCGYRGSFVLLVSDVLCIQWDEAVRWVRERGGIERVRKVLQRSKQPLVKTDTTRQINEASLALYTPPPASMLEQRNLSLTACQDLGILWDPKKELWILPIRDPDTGKLWGWQEKHRTYVYNRPPDVKKSKTLFGLQAFRGTTAILLESPLDVARLRSIGITTGLASYGVAVSDAQMQLVVDVADSVIVALDNDKDGIKYSGILQQMFSSRIAMYFLSYEHTDAKDIGEMTEADIRVAIDQASPSVITRFRAHH